MALLEGMFAVEMVLSNHLARSPLPQHDGSKRPHPQIKVFHDYFADRRLEKFNIKAKMQHISLFFMDYQMIIIRLSPDAAFSCGEACKRSGSRRNSSNK